MLDLGCGPGYVLEYLSAVDYVGFDTEAKYIEYARERYAGRGAFHCEVFSERHAETLEPFDAVLLFGLPHHLDDGEAAFLRSIRYRRAQPMPYSTEGTDHAAWASLASECLIQMRPDPDMLLETRLAR